MKPVLIAFALLLPFGHYAQTARHDPGYELRGNGRVVRETKQVKSFEAIEIDQFPARVVVEAGASESSVTISIDDNLRSWLVVDDRNGTLRLAFKSPGNRPLWVSKSSIDVVIRTSTLQRFRHGSNSDVAVRGLRGESFAFVNGANGNVRLEGKVKTFDLVSNANGHIDAAGLLATTANVLTQANATIRINARDVNEVRNANAEVINVAN
ncbi:GIN domain-containing protein [uncultured Fibrella sp.]|uniref:GIN domain-containing protein n=1 Tax=uncultured Fibrella sp. TaxID=1284596 RepID=UPI0035C9576C